MPVAARVWRRTNMRTFCLLLNIACVLACCGYGREPAVPEKRTGQKPAPQYQGKPLGHWVAMSKSTSRESRQAALAALAEYLKDKDYDVWCGAVGALGEMGPEATPAIRSLLISLEDKNWHILEGDGGGDMPGPPPRPAAGPAYAALEKIGRAAIPTLMDLLKDKDAKVRMRAVGCLGEFGPRAWPAVAALTELLKDKNGEVRNAATNVLVTKLRREAKPAVPIIVESLTDEDWKVRYWTGRNLSQIGPHAKAAIPALTAALKDEHPYVRAGAAEALASMRRAAIPALMRLVKDTDPQVRRGAVFALGNMGPETKTSIDALAELLKDENGDVRAEAARGLGQVIKTESGFPLPAPAETQAALVAQDLGRVDPEAKAAIPALTALFHDKEGEVRRAAILAVGGMGPEAKADVPALIALLADKDAGVRWAAATVLQAIGPPAEAAIPALTKLLKDPESAGPHFNVMGTGGTNGEGGPVRLSAAIALGVFGPKAKTAVPALTELLNDKYMWVPVVAAETLGKIGPEAKTAVPALIELLKRKATDSNVRYEAIRALGAIGDAKEAIPALTELRKEHNYSVSMAAARALWSIKSWSKERPPTYNGRTLEQLAAMAESTDRRMRWQAAMDLRLAGSAAAPILTELLKGDDHDIQRIAASNLACIGPETKAAIPLLIELFKVQNTDAPNDARGAAAEALGKIGPAAIPALMPLLKKESAARGAAASALGGMGAEAKTAVPALTELLKDEDDQVRRAAASALGWIGTGAKTAIPALTELVKDRNGQVRYDAITALGKTGSQAIPALTGFLKNEAYGDRDTAIRALGDTGPAAVPVLTGLLKEKDAQARWLAGQSLDKIGPEAQAAIPALTDVINDKDEKPHIRFVLVTVLRRFGAEAKVVLPALTDVLKSDNSWVRAHAAEVLGKIGPPAQAATPALTDLLKDKEGEVRAAAASALGQIGPGAKAAIPVLRESLWDKEAPVRKAADEALDKIIED